MATKKDKKNTPTPLKIEDVIPKEMQEKYKVAIDKSKEKAKGSVVQVINKPLIGSIINKATILTPPSPPPSTQPARSIDTFKTQLHGYGTQLSNLLNGTGISPEKFTHIVLSEVKKSDKLLQAFLANPASMFASILAGAEIGLIPSDMIGDFYLIPRSIKQENGSHLLTVTPLIGYKGLVSILLRSGDITRIHTEVVYEGDIFEPIYGFEPNIIHKPNFDVPRTADKIKYAYAVAKNKNGEYSFAVMTRKEIEGVGAMAKYENKIYFNDNEGINRWMERKAVLIQLSKLLPKDYYSKRAISMDGLLQGGALLTMDTDNKIKIIKTDDTPVRPARFRNIYQTFSENSSEQESE